MNILFLNSDTWIPPAIPQSPKSPFRLNRENKKVLFSIYPLDLLKAPLVLFCGTGFFFFFYYGTQ